jgi:hypothetical protein
MQKSLELQKSSSVPDLVEDQRTQNKRGKNKRKEMRGESQSATNQQVQAEESKEMPPL